MGTTILSVDPGLSGAVCRLTGETLELRRDFKTLPDIARAIHELSEGVTHAIIELVHAMPGQGVCSMFSFGRAAGVADGALALALPGIVVEQVTPQKWQNFFRLRYGIVKGQPFNSREIALKIFPDKADLFKRKKDHNSADSALIAVWKAVQLSASVDYWPALPKLPSGHSPAHTHGCYQSDQENVFQKAGGRHAVENL